MKLSLILSTMMLLSSTSFALHDPSILEASPEAKKAILRELLVAIPAYLVESEKVLEVIEQNATEKKLTDQTKLSKTKIKGLFASGQKRLSKILSEAQFQEGRDDADVAWLKQSVLELKKLNKLLGSVYESQDGYKNLDAFFVNASYSQDETSEDVSIDIQAVSRFYCNLTVTYSKMENEISISTAEVCD